MPKLPPHKPREVIKKLRKLGFELDHQTGSHAIFYKEGHPFPVSVPRHKKDLKKGTLFGIIERAGSTPGEFAKIK